MKSFRLVFLILLISSSSFAQKVHVGAFGGVAAYNGDLTDKIFPKKVTNGAVGITLSYELDDQLILRGGFTYAIVGGADRFSDKPDIRERNLSFETKIYELSAVAELYLNNLYDRKFSPYVFGGVAAFHFNPYAYNGSAQKVYLKPLSTEGQGIVGYPDRKPYKLNQFAIPGGIGLKYAVNDNLRIGIEGGLRKLFTDYFDDVSKDYVSEGDLLAARGQLAVDMAFRGDDVNGSLPYPGKGAQRGSPKSKDIYYFTGIHVTYKLGSAGGGGFGGGKKNRNGCPVNVY